MPADESVGYMLAMISFIGSPSSELFLSLSGAVLLPVKSDIGSFYKRRFGKLIPPFVFWSIIILAINIATEKQDISSAFNALLFLPIRPVTGIYWFIYVMIGLYLLAPFISPWLKTASKKQVELFLAIWCINMLMPYLNLISPNIYSQNGSHYWMLNYFGGFLGFWILGYYLRKYPIPICFNRRWLLILSGFILYILTLAVLYFKNTNVSPYFDNLQIGSAILVALMYTICQNYPIKNRLTVNIIKEIATYSFGIYLIHGLVVRRIIWTLFENSTINPLIETPIIAILSLLLCYIILWVLHFLPYHKYIVGR